MVSTLFPLHAFLFSCLQMAIQDQTHEFCPSPFEHYYNGSCYYYPGSLDTRTYDKAAASCQGIGGKLSSLNTRAEAEEVARYLSSKPDYEADGVNNRYWFGGRRVPGTGNPGEWVWEDGTNMEFTFWFSSEPSGAPGQMCLIVLLHGNQPFTYLWWDTDCRIDDRYVCELQLPKGRCGIISSDSALSDGRNETCYQVHPTDTLETLLTFKPRDYCYRKSKMHFRLDLGSSFGNKTCGFLEKMFYSQMRGCGGLRHRACRVIDAEKPGMEGTCDIECVCDDGDDEQCKIILLALPSGTGSKDDVIKVCQATLISE